MEFVILCHINYHHEMDSTIITHICIARQLLLLDFQYTENGMSVTMIYM
jgi:hypothetical protein